ncbi:DUF3080 family protein [Aliidiomarina sp. Khilg15.8]
MPVLKSMRARSVASFRWARKSVLALAALSLAAACSQPDESEQILSQYQQTLANLNAHQSAPPARQAMMNMPRSTDLRTEIERISIGLLDSMQLDKCRAGGLVADRNSALGKMKSPSAQLRYELDSLMALAECRKSPVTDDERLDDLLAEAIEHKQRTLPHYIDRALATGAEMRHALRPATSLLPRGEDGHAPAIAALTYLTQLLQTAVSQPSASMDLDAYNRHFQTLAQSDFLPQHWRSQMRLQAWFNAFNAELAAFTDHLDCDANWQAGAAEFRQSILPLARSWEDYQHQITPLVRQLRTFSAHPEWQRYLASLIALGGDIPAQIQQHKLHWSQIEKSCEG